MIKSGIIWTDLLEKWAIEIANLHHEKDLGVSLTVGPSGLKIGRAAWSSTDLRASHCVVSVAMCVSQIHWLLLEIAKSVCRPARIRPPSISYGELCSAFSGALPSFCVLSFSGYSQALQGIFTFELYPPPRSDVATLDAKNWASEVVVIFLH